MDRETLASLGVGAFETIKVTVTETHFELFFFEEHIDRLTAAIRTLDHLLLKRPSKDTLLSQIQKELTSKTFAFDAEVRLRIIVTPASITVSAQPFTPRISDGESARLFPLVADRPLPEIKSTSCVVSFHAQEIAKKHGFHEALFMSEKGIIREGAWSNFFWVTKSNRIKTPATRLLKGITREAVRTVCEVIEEDAPLDIVLSEAKEAFITNAMHGVIPVSQIGDFTIDESSITRGIKDHYNSRRLERVFKLPK